MPFLYFFLGSFFLSCLFCPVLVVFFFIVACLFSSKREREKKKECGLGWVCGSKTITTISYENNLYSIKIKIINKEKNHFGEFGMEKLKNPKISASTFIHYTFFFCLVMRCF